MCQLISKSTYNTLQLYRVAQVVTEVVHDFIYFHDLMTNQALLNNKTRHLKRLACNPLGHSTHGKSTSRSNPTVYPLTSSHLLALGGEKKGML